MAQLGVGVVGAALVRFRFSDPVPGHERGETEPYRRLARE